MARNWVKDAALAALLVGGVIAFYACFVGLIFGIGWFVDRAMAPREARQLLDAVWSRAAVYYRAEHQTVSGVPEDQHFLVGTAPECGCPLSRFCPGNDPIWERDPVWQALGFSIHEPRRYRVSYEGKLTGFIVRVRGDLDGDGILAEFSRGGDVDTVANPKEAKTIEVHPYE